MEKKHGNQLTLSEVNGSSENRTAGPIMYIEPCPLGIFKKTTINNFLLYSYLLNDNSDSFQIHFYPLLLSASLFLSMSLFLFLFLAFAVVSLSVLTSCPLIISSQSNTMHLFSVFRWVSPISFSLSYSLSFSLFLYILLTTRLVNGAERKGSRCGGRCYSLSIHSCVIESYKNQLYVTKNGDQKREHDIQWYDVCNKNDVINSSQFKCFITIWCSKKKIQFYYLMHIHPSISLSSNNILIIAKIIAKIPIQKLDSQKNKLLCLLTFQVFASPFSSNYVITQSYSYVQHSCSRLPLLLSLKSLPITSFSSLSFLRNRLVFDVIYNCYNSKSTRFRNVQTRKRGEG